MERSSRKRKHPETRSTYSRKRAVTACSLCRVRKVKCDNQRPSCGMCLLADAMCDYKDGSNSDLSSFDPASLAILDKLNTAIELLQGQAHIPGLIKDLIAPQYDTLLQRDSGYQSALPSSVSPPIVPNDEFSPLQLPRHDPSVLDEAVLGPGRSHNILECMFSL